MARSYDIKGLLYSPEVLAGFGLLGAGLQGQSPQAAIPSLLQGVQTAGAFSQFEDQEKKRKFLEKYGETVPEEDKPLFGAFPDLYIKQKINPPKPSTVNLFGPGLKTPITLNLNNPTDYANFNILTKQGYYEVGKPTVQATSLEGLQAGKAATNELDKSIISGEGLMQNLNRMEVYFEPEFLQYKGKAKAEIFSALDKLGLGDSEKNAFLKRFNAWDAASQQYFNQYRKEITGVAAGEKEIGWLQASIPSEKDSPATYKAKLQLQKNIQRNLIDRARRFKAAGLGVATDADGNQTKEFKDYIKNNPLQPSKQNLQTIFDSYIGAGYSEDQLIKIMNLEFPDVDWKSILGIG